MVTRDALKHHRSVSNPTKFVSEDFIDVFAPLLEKYKQLALLDEVTQIPNRNAYAIKLSEVQTYRLPIGIMIIDLNDFKQINDTYGHDYGDHALYDIAQVLKSSIRSGDFVARIGGDEFAIILGPSTKNPDESMKAIDNRINHNLNSYNDTAKVKIGLSAGYATSQYEGREHDAGELNRQADKMMYKNKYGKKS